MKRFIALVLSLVMALSLCAPAWGVGEVVDINGAGTADKPYEVYTETGLAAAIVNVAAYENGGYITLMDDIDLTEGVTVPAGASATIDLNGKTITGTTGRDADNNRVHVLVNNGTLTVKNGTITSAGENGGSAVYNAAGATLTIEDVTINGAPQSGDSWPSYAINCSGDMTIDGATITSNHGAISVSNGAKVSIDNTNVTMNGFGGSSHVFYIGGTGTEVVVNSGTYTHKGNVDGSLAYIMSGTKMIINGGTFSASNGGYGLAAYNGALIVNGGTFTNSFQEWGGPISVTGGTFSFNPNKYVDPEVSTMDTVDGKYVVTQLPDVAEAGGVKYKTLQAAVDAVKDGGEIKLLDNVTFDENTRMSSGGSWYEGLYYTGDKSFTVDLNGKTITNDSSVNDYLLLFKNTGSKANTITFKNGTIEAASSAYCAICTSTVSTQKITINLESVNLINNNSNGAAAKIRGGAEMNVKNGTVITGKNSYVGIEAVNKGTVVNIYDGAEIYQKGTSSYVGSLVGVSNNATANVYGGYGESAKGAFIAMTSGGTINVSGGEWIANTDGTPKNDNDGVLIAQNDKTTYTNAGNSIINVTGGAFKGGYNCYGNAVGDAQINISGGYFNADPTAYCADGYICAFNSDAKVYTVQKKGAAADNGAVKEDVTENLNNAAASDAVVDAVQQTTTNTVTVAETTIELTDAGKTTFQNAIAENKADPTNKPLEIETEIAISDVTDTLAAAVQDELKDELKDVAGDDAKVAAILDIDIHVFVNDQHVGQLTELPQPITITLDLPEIEEELKDGYRRSYFVIIHHDDVAEKIPATVSGDKLIITSDRFSPYALGYVDTEIPTGGYYPYYPPTTTPDSELVKSPDTFDAGIALYVGVSVMGAIGTVVLGKKRED